MPPIGRCEPAWSDTEGGRGGFAETEREFGGADADPGVGKAANVTVGVEL